MSTLLSSVVTWLWVVTLPSLLGMSLNGSLSSSPLLLFSLLLLRLLARQAAPMFTNADLVLAHIDISAIDSKGCDQKRNPCHDIICIMYDQLELYACIVENNNIKF